jgi:hypothetical protein
MPHFFSTRTAAAFLDTDEWRVRRLFESGTLPEPPRFAGKRVITGEIIPSIIDALRARGWLPESAVLTGKMNRDTEQQEASLPEASGDPVVITHAVIGETKAAFNSLKPHLSAMNGQLENVVVADLDNVPEHHWTVPVDRLASEIVKNREAV